MAKTYKLLEVRDLNTSFKIDAGRVLAVNGVSFTLDKGKILGIVGESGSGKSVSAYSIMRILDKNGKIDSGKILYNGTDLVKLSEKEMRDIRGNKISIIFQDAMTSLNPTWSIGNQLREAILTHNKNPIKLKLEPLRNAIISDKQRIESMNKGLLHHPDSQELKDDLEFVKDKLAKDLEQLRIQKVTEKQQLKVNESKIMREYKTEVAGFNAKIKEARKIYFSEYKKLNPEPSKEEIFGHNHYKNHIAAINAAAQLHRVAKDYFEMVNNNKENIRKSPNYARLKVMYRVFLRRARRNLKLTSKDYESAKKALAKYVKKFKREYILRPRVKRYKAYKEARLAKRNFYWDCRSAYRETKYSANKKALAMLKEVGITEPEKRLKQYPFELSGGMLQRCMIAMALVQHPDILIADEPTTALDVTIQAQILDLLKKLQKEYGMAILIITHDLGVVAQICDEVNIMYAGRIVERGTTDDIFYNPQHEYTKGLLKSMPKLNQPKGLLDPIKGNPVDLFCLPKGCAFASRCASCMKICIEKYPEEVTFDYHSGHCASCWAMVKRMHDEHRIDVVKGTPTGKPLIYNGAVISNLKKSKKDKKKKNEESAPNSDIQKEELKNAEPTKAEDNKTVDKVKKDGKENSKGKAK